LEFRRVLFRSSDRFGLVGQVGGVESHGGPFARGGGFGLRVGDGHRVGVLGVGGSVGGDHHGFALAGVQQAGGFSQRFRGGGEFVVAQRVGNQATHGRELIVHVLADERQSQVGVSQGRGAGGGREGPLGSGDHLAHDDVAQEGLEVSGDLAVEFGHGQCVLVGGGGHDGSGLQVQLQPGQGRQGGVAPGAGAQQ